MSEQSGGPPVSATAAPEQPPMPGDQAIATPRTSLWGRVLTLEPYIVVFLASGITLILEIVAARILAPHIGVSVYTWTSVIGVILAGISIGNWLGGLVADRWGSRVTLGLILIVGAAFTAVVPALATVVPQWVSKLPILVRIVALTTSLFLLPALVLAMVSPVVLKLTLRDLRRTGSVAGRIYAVSTAGAILGTFLTGFVLVQAFGSRPTVYGLAVSLLALAVLSGRLWKSWRTAAAGAVALVAAGATIAAIGKPLESPCIKESAYFCIRIFDSTAADGSQVKQLVLDNLVHSYVKLDDPTHLEYSYQKHFAALIAGYVAPDRPDFRSLFIGGGGYELPRLIEVVYPESTIEVIEIDPAVTGIVHEQLALPVSTRIVSYHRDARMAVPDLPKREYDIVVGDAFNDLSVPWHLTTKDFNQEIKSLLRPGGMYAMNIVDAPQSGRFLHAMVYTLQETWAYVYLLNTMGDMLFNDRAVTAVVASDRPIDETTMRIAYTRATGQTPETRLVPDVTFRLWLGSQDKVVLTDDFAPVDNYLAPLYLRSR